MATAVVIALVPLALGAGVLIGRSSAGGDAKLIAALRAEKAPVIQYGAGAGSALAASAGTSANSGPPTSTFKLTHGYAVELGTLPASSDAAAAGRAEKAAKAKGAGSVGIIAQSDFVVTPRPPGGDYILYTGASATEAAAARVMGKLKSSFPAARVISVRAAGTAGGGRVLTHTRYGTAHQVTGYKATPKALAQGAQVAQQDSHSTGKQASGIGLPDVVSVP